MHKYNCCFIRRGGHLLLLNRHKPPVMGLWNGVGGKIEPGESPRASALREIHEETGIALVDVWFGGTVTWTTERGEGGMYVFLADLPDQIEFPTPVETDEGILTWKPLAWVLEPQNQGVMAQTRQYLAHMLSTGRPYRYHCTFRDGRLAEFTVLGPDPADPDALC